jgi:hypothetical protein
VGNSSTKILPKTGQCAWIWRITSSKQGFEEIFASMKTVKTRAVAEIGWFSVKH